jgi:hypothetical protein
MHKALFPTLNLVVLAGSAFAQINDPRDLEGNVLWLDGSDVDGDFTPGGNFVEGADRADKSLSGNADARQVSASRRPEVTSNALNDRSVVRFDGSDIMDVDSAAFGMLKDVEGATLFGLAMTSDAASQGGQRVFMISSGTNAAGTRAGLNLYDTFGTSIGGTGEFGLAGRREDSDPFQRIEGGEVIAGEFALWSGVFDYANGRLALYVNGATSRPMPTTFNRPAEQALPTAVILPQSISILHQAQLLNHHDSV